MSANTHPTIVVDFDGTLVESAWPDIGDWMPGAREAMRAFNNAGYSILLHSVRLLPFDPWGGPIPAAQVAAEIARVRHKLDTAGLTFIRIWTLPGKPPGAVYIDDKAERYGGRVGSWRAMTEKVLMRLGADEFAFPAFPEVEDLHV
jgi:hypothetical protein